MLKKPVSLLLILSMILSIAMPINVYASDNDYAGHWAGDTIQQWIDEGKISGYPDGSFKPDNNVTRAEFVTMVNKAFNFTATTDISFTDVNSNDWFYQEVQKASNAGYIVGVSETQFDPSSNLTREQASVIVARILNLNSDSESSDVFNDLNDVSSWATELVLASAKAGIIKGYEDNTFRPQNPITRAEAVVILDRAVKTNDVVEPPEPTIPAEPEEPDKPDTPSHKGSSSSGGRHSGGRHDEEELKVAEVSAIKDITVEFGGELKLPGTVKATLNDEEETEVTLAIDWAENKDFDAKKAGNYEFTGTLSKLKDEELKFTIPEDKATVTVKVTVEKTNPGEDTIHVTGIELDEHSITLQNGETATLTYTISPLDATNKDVTWKSSDSNVAVVKGTSSEKSTGSAIVTAKTTGTAIVTVTTDDGDKTAECKVTVTEAGEEAELAQAIEAAEEAIAALPTVEEVKVEDKEAVANAKALVEAVKALDAEAVVEGEEVIVELEAKIAELEEAATKELTVESVSAINDLKAKTVTIEGKVVKAEEVEEKATVVAEFFVADKDGQFPEKGTETTVELDEDGKFKHEVVKVADYKEGSYKVVVKATAGELEAEAIAEFEIDKAELEAIDAVVAAVKNAKNQLELEEALKAEEFENVDFDKIADYEEALKADGVVLNTVADIQKVIDSVNKGQNEKALLDNIIKARDAGVDKDLLAALNAADLKVKDKDGKDVAVEIKVDAVKKYYVALASIDEDSSLVDVAEAIKTENERPLKEVNEATTAEGMKTALKDNADRLGLDLTAFNKIDSETGQPGGRQTAVLNDLIDNMPEDGYTEETLKLTFDEIVATRMVFQKSVELFASASKDEPLTDLTYITMLIDQLESVSYEKHSNESIKEVRLPALKDLVDRFNALEGEKVTLDDEEEAIDAQKAVLKTIDYSEPLSSTITRNRLDTALTAVEEKVEELSEVTSVEAEIETELPADNTVKAGTVVTVKLTAKNNDDTQEKFNKVIPKIDVKHGDDNGNYIVLRNVVFEKGVATVDVKLEKALETAAALSFGKIAGLDNDVTTTETIAVEAGDLTVIEGKVTEAGVVLTGKDDYKNEIALDADDVVDATIDGEDILLANISGKDSLTISDLELEAETEYTITLVYKVGEETKTFEITFKTPKVEAKAETTPEE